MEEACFVGLQLGELGGDGVGYEVGAARVGGEGELRLEPGRGLVCGFLEDIYM